MIFDDFWGRATVATEDSGSRLSVGGCPAFERRKVQLRVYRAPQAVPQPQVSNTAQTGTRDTAAPACMESALMQVEADLMVEPQPLLQHQSHPLAGYHLQPGFDGNRPCFNVSERDADVAAPHIVSWISALRTGVIPRHPIPRLECAPHVSIFEERLRMRAMRQGRGGECQFLSLLFQAPITACGTSTTAMSTPSGQLWRIGSPKMGTADVTTCLPP